MSAILLCQIAGHSIKAQEISLPQRWQDALICNKTIFRQDTLSILVLGDVMMHSAQIENAKSGKNEYDFSTYFRHIEDEIKEADIAIANMEVTFAGEPYTGYPCFSAPDSFASYIADCGFDIFLAANNHIFDKGVKGAERTIGIYRSLMESHGIQFTGIASDEKELHDNNPLILRKKGITIALLNFTYGTNLGLSAIWPKTNYIGEKEKIKAAISRAEGKADYIIALPHWGTEYKLRHSPGQEVMAEWLAENGVDCIIGSHPHVVQDCDTSGTVPTVYSLGNAVSNMSAPNTQLELMARIRIIRKSNGDIVISPLELDYLWCSRPGGYDNSYTVLPVGVFIGRRQEWKNPGDYDKMVTTYERVRKETGIE